MSDEQMKLNDTQFFTVVFEGDVRNLSFNPIKAETVFGKVVAVGVGNAFDEGKALKETPWLAPMDRQLED